MLLNFADTNFPYCVVVSETKQGDFTNYLFGETKDVIYCTSSGLCDDSQYFHFDNEADMTVFVSEKKSGSDDENSFFKDATQYMHMRDSGTLVCREINEEEKRQLIEDILERNPELREKYVAMLKQPEEIDQQRKWRLINDFGI